MVCHCGVLITRAPFLVDSHSCWLHENTGRIVCESGQFAAPDPVATFRRCDRLCRAIQEFRQLESTDFIQ